jgi:hypothetical protein
MATKRKARIRLDKKVTETPVVVVGDRTYEVTREPYDIGDIFECGEMLEEVVGEGETWAERAQILRAIADAIEALPNV